ncbi:hypothetical protein Tco_1321610, partial [Tanacetum coccineum]
MFPTSKIKKNDNNEVQYSLRTSLMIYLNTPALFLLLVDEHTTKIFSSSQTDTPKTDKNYYTVLEGGMISSTSSHLGSIPILLHLAQNTQSTHFIPLSSLNDKLREEAQAENQDFLNSLDSNMKRIIKEQVKAQTSKIMTKVEKYVTETLGAEVLVRSTNQPQTSYAVASSLSELELKKIIMDKIEENKSIDRSEVQKNLYNALVKAYNFDKYLLSSYLLSSYGDVVTIPRGHD